MKNTHSDQDAIESLAADWVARDAGGSLSRAERQALDAWLAESPRHEEAFAEAQASWSLMGAVAETLPRAPDRRSPSRFPWRPVALAAVIALLLVAGLSPQVGDPRLLITADRRTGPGEIARIALDDGGTLTLGPESAVSIRYAEGRRAIVLLSGIAAFEATPVGDDETRPFVVSADEVTVRALGTRFVVERLDGGAEVSVQSHRVAVTLAEPDQGDGAPVPDGDAMLLSEGEAVRAGPEGLGPLRNLDPRDATAWQHGRLVFDRRPLGEVVAVLNRYQRTPILLGDGQMTEREVSGAFTTTDPDAVLAILAATLDVRVTSLRPFAILIH